MGVFPASLRSNMLRRTKLIGLQENLIGLSLAAGAPARGHEGACCMFLCAVVLRVGTQGEFNGRKTMNVVKKLMVEAPGEFKVSSADAVLAALA